MLGQWQLAEAGVSKAVWLSKAIEASQSLSIPALLHRFLKPTKRACNADAAAAPTILNGDKRKKPLTHPFNTPLNGNKPRNRECKKVWERKR
jgi:hypothetical protein